MGSTVPIFINGNETQYKFLFQVFNNQILLQYKNGNCNINV